MHTRIDGIEGRVPPRRGRILRKLMKSEGLGSEHWGSGAEFKNLAESGTSSCFPLLVLITVYADMPAVI